MEQKILLNLLQHAINGKEWEEEYKIDGYKVYSLARQQGIAVLIFPVLKMVYEKGFLEMKQEDFKSIEDETMQMCMRYTKKQFAVYSILEKMKSTGIDYVVMKGDTLAYLYAYPEYRISSDTDILIDKEKEEECCSFLKKNGAQVTDRAEDNNERAAVHKNFGTIEIHVDYNTKTVSEVWYENINVQEEKTREVLIFDLFKVECMGYTDVAINLFLHFIKHYIGGIAHLRMLADLMVFLDCEHNNIDFVRFNKVLEKLKYKTVFKCMEYIAVTYLGLKSFMTDEKIKDLAVEFISDIFVCGEYNAKNVDIGCYDYFSQKKYNKINSGSYVEYKKEIISKKIYRIIIPHKLTMEKKYSILRRHKFLLPFAYVYRWMDVLLFRNRRKKKQENSVDKYKVKRENLIDNMQMI